MKTPMTYPIRFWALLLLGLMIFQFSSEALGDSCRYEKKIDMTLDLSSSELLSIFAAAGDLDVIGEPGLDEAVITGRVCASKEEWLEESVVNTQSGSQASIEVDLPDINGGWSLTGNRYVWMDLRVKVPENLALAIKDSSGDVFLKNVADMSISDSSGDIDIEDARGLVSVRDSSGDIEVNHASGDLTIESDSSGDIILENIIGSVRVVSDSSGDIEATVVSGDVIVERDSSGDISVRDVGGDFHVLKDGSGRISSHDVAGEVKTPRKS